MMFKATEFDRTTCQQTGRVEYYQAPGIKVAVNHVLYTRRLTDGYAKVGPTGRVVYAGPFGYAVTSAS